MRGLGLFAEQAAETGFVRYGDFTNNPETELQSLCEQLELPYDASWRARWAAYGNITGDNRASDIMRAKRHAVEAGLRRLLDGNTDYRKSLKLLGYES